MDINLGRGLSAKIDEADFPIVGRFRWHILKNERGVRYAAATVGRSTLLIHRLLVSPPNGLFVDHINGDGLDNRRENLRIATMTQNLANMRPRPGKYKGVSLDKRRRSNPWRAYISVGNKSRHLGTFATSFEAAKAYDAAAKEIHGEFAWTNFRSFKTVAA